MTHRYLGMGDFPLEPIAGYLARTTSIWFAIYGLLLWYVSFDTQKYAALIRFLATILFVQGFLIAAIDWTEGLPTWWIGMEGLVCSGMGLSLFVLQRDIAINEPS